MEEFWKTNYIEIVPPVDGAPEGIKKLRELGFRLVVVTARQVREMHRGKKWLETHFPGMFDGMICTGQSQETLAEPHEALTKLSKAGVSQISTNDACDGEWADCWMYQVCHKLGAKLLIDDSIENALKCLHADPPVPVLLFGDREWNKRESKYENINTELSFEQRLEKEGGREFWKEENVEIPEGAPLTRVNDWVELVAWVEETRHAGCL